MKKTVACVAMIATATAFAAGKDAAKREPAATDSNTTESREGMTYVGCKPGRPIFKDAEEYKNNCVTTPKEVRTPGGFGGRLNMACPKGYQVIVSSEPVVGSCLPPGAVEL